MKNSRVFSWLCMVSPYHKEQKWEAFLRFAYSEFGYEPRTLTKLHSCPTDSIALATLRSCMWPSQSMKKKYSHALRLLGRDSILVRLMRLRRKAASAWCSAPTLSAMLTMRSEERRVGKEGRSRWSPYH